MYALRKLYATVVVITALVSPLGAIVTPLVFFFFETVYKCVRYENAYEVLCDATPAVLIRRSASLIRMYTCERLLMQFEPAFHA